MTITLKHPDAPATKKQLWTLEQLSGKSYKDADLTMQSASNMIEALELKKIADARKNQVIDDRTPFQEPHVTIVEGDQRSGKTTYVIGKTKDAYYKFCVKKYCLDILHMDCEVKAYDSKTRVAKIKYKGEVKLIQIPKDYKLNAMTEKDGKIVSGFKVFSNIHIYGFPYVYIPSFRHLLKWLENGFISDGYLIVDEAHIGISARSGMTSQGQGFVDQYFQFGKSRLEVFLITHMARLIDWTARTVPTQRVHCTYNEKKKEITYTLQRKGQRGETEHTFDATQYWCNMNSNEKVKK